MSLPSAKLREIVFQFLFCHDFFESDQQEVVKTLMHLHKVSKKNAKEAFFRMEKIKEKLEEIDLIISEASKEYTIDRICRSEKNLIRLSVYELFFDEKIPPKVAIAESIRLARKFSSKESSNFVNAVLDFVYHNSLKQTAAL